MSSTWRTLGKIVDDGHKWADGKSTSILKSNAQWSLHTMFMHKNTLEEKNVEGVWKCSIQVQTIVKTALRAYY